MKISINASAVTPSGEGIQLVGNEVSITLQPAATPAPDPEGYYIVGDFTAWNGTDAQPMKKDALNENLYTLEAEIEVLPTATPRAIISLPGPMREPLIQNWTVRLKSRSMLSTTVLQ